MTEERAATPPTNGQPAGSRQYVQFIFYKVDPAWRRLPAAEREAMKDEVVAAVDEFAGRMQVRPYTLVGVRGDADFMFWHIADSLEPFQEAATRLLGTRLGPYLSTPYAYLSLTRKSVYVDKGEPSAASRRLRLTPGTAKYLFVYPFVKTRPWYNLPLEKRQEMMDTHIRVGRKYPSVKLNTTYSFGLDDQEFVVAFETDEPGDFLDLVMELRETESSLYTLRDTPTFTCVATTVRGMLDALGSPGVAAAPGAGPGWTRVADPSDLPEGSTKVVYAGGDQVALFNVGGAVYAVEARCPHGNAPLVEGTIEGTVLTCAWHGSQFDFARNCEIARGPAARPPRTYPVRVDGDGIFVSSESPVPASP
jgi:chlorite dismutase/nitrite reductase/ring-hydroxylating ferredoxin subunit